MYNYQITNLDDNNKELQIEYDFGADNLLLEHNGNYIFNPILFKPRLTQFNQEDYKYHRLKDYHRTLDYQYEFEIPKNFKVKYIPQNSSYSHAKFDFVSSYRLEDKVLVVSFIYHYRLLEIPPIMFDTWNEFSDQINKATAQCIILEKTN